MQLVRRSSPGPNINGLSPVTAFIVAALCEKDFERINRLNSLVSVNVSLVPYDVPQRFTTVFQLSSGTDEAVSMSRETFSKGNKRQR